MRTYFGERGYKNSAAPSSSRELKGGTQLGTDVGSKVTIDNSGTKEHLRVPREALISLSGYVEHRPDASVEVPVAKGFL